MKRNMIIAALAVAGIATYIWNRKKGESVAESAEQGFDKAHHLTNVFSKAKDHAMS